MKAAVLAALLALPVAAQEHCPSLSTILALGEKKGETTKADALALGWSMLLPHRHVRISVRMESGYDDYSIVTAYLVRRIGPSTHPINEVARTSYELPPSFEGEWILFEDLELETGEYWLVFERPPHARHGEPEWVISKIGGMSSGYGVEFLGTRSYSYVNHRAEYTPAAHYGQTSTLQGYAVSVSGVPAY